MECPPTSLPRRLDRGASPHNGALKLIWRIREGRPELLMAGEAWYDAVGVATPLMQSGHTDGVLHWLDVPSAPFFDTYNRSFAHICLGDPGRGSTGAHELGHNPIRRSPLRKSIIPHGHHRGGHAHQGVCGSPEDHRGCLGVHGALSVPALAPWLRARRSPRHSSIYPHYSSLNAPNTRIWKIVIAATTTNRMTAIEEA